MKNTKKVLALVLTVVMLLGTMTMAAFAASYTATGVEDTTGLTNIKYSVTQVPEVVADDGTYHAVNNNVYAVTVYAKTAEGIDYLTLPIFYNKLHFDVLAYVAADDYAMLNNDADYGDSAVATYKLGEAWSDTSMYNKTGGKAATKTLARFIGLGNPNASAVGVTADNFMDGVAAPGNWATNVDTSTYGIMRFNIDDQALDKNAFINAIDFHVIGDRYVEIITFYFLRKDTVAETDCYGDIFGVIGDDKYGLDVETCASGYPSYTKNGDFPWVDGQSKINIINAAVEAPIKPLVDFTKTTAAQSQGIAFKLATGATKEYTESDIASVDYRFVAQFSTTAFTLEYDSTGKITNTNIDEVGFVMTRTDSGKTVADLKAADIAALTKDSGDIRKCWTEQISSGIAGDAAFAFSCRIAGIGAEDSANPLTGSFSLSRVTADYLVVPYVLLDDGTVYYGADMTSSIAARYTANVDKFLTNKNAA